MAVAGGHALQRRELPYGEQRALFSGHLGDGRIIELRLRGRTAALDVAPAPTMFFAASPDLMAPLWLGLRGLCQTLTVIVGRDPDRSPSCWLGPDLPAGRDVDIHVAFCPHMGPGGMLYRNRNDQRWSSLSGATTVGLEQFAWPSRWIIGYGQGGPRDRAFKGASLTVDALLE